MSSNIYLPNVIFKYKSKVKSDEKTILFFKKIRKNMPQPTYRIKNKSSSNNDKWFCKKFTNNDEKVKKKINGYLNKFTDKNYLEISDKILKLKIHNLELLTYLIDNFLEKTITETYYINYWSYLLEKLIFNNKKWNFEFNTFLSILYDNLQSYFESLIEEDYEEKLTQLKSVNIKEYYTEKKKNTGFALLLARLYKLKLINIKLLNKCIGELLSNYNIYYVTVAVTLIKTLRKSISNKYLNVYDDLLKSLINSDDTSKKIKFIILDYIENNSTTKQNYLSSENEVNIEANIKAYMDEYLENVNYKDMVYYMKEFKNYQMYQVVYEIFRYSINLSSDKKNQIFELLIKFFKDDILNNKFLRKSLELVFKDYEDLKLDYPNIDKNIKLFVGSLKKNKLLDRRQIDNLCRINKKIDI